MTTATVAAGSTDMSAVDVGDEDRSRIGAGYRGRQCPSWAAAPATATFPGRDGRFAVQLDGCESTPFIRFIAVEGQDPGS